MDSKLILNADLILTSIDLGDLIGRRLAFNMTLFIGAVFGLASGAAPSFTALAVMLALVGTGVGGNCK